MKLNSLKCKKKKNYRSLANTDVVFAYLHELRWATPALLDNKAVRISDNRFRCQRTDLTLGFFTFHSHLIL